MKTHLELLRLYFVLLAIFVIGRWGMGLGGVEYAKGHHVFSLVILTIFSALYYGAFARRYRRYTVAQAMTLAALIAFSAQLAIVVSSILSFAVGESYFTHPVALQQVSWDDYLAGIGSGARLDSVGFGFVMQQRLIGVVANTITGSIIGALGWALGALLPEPSLPRP